MVKKDEKWGEKGNNLSFLVIFLSSACYFLLLLLLVELLFSCPVKIQALDKKTTQQLNQKKDIISFLISLLIIFNCFTVV